MPPMRGVQERSGGKMASWVVDGCMARSPHAAWVMGMLTVTIPVAGPSRSRFSPVGH